MTPGTAVVLALVLIAAAFALRAMLQHRTGGCSGCTGDCMHCGKRAAEPRAANAADWKNRTEQ